MKVLIIPCCAAALTLGGAFAGFAQDKSSASKQSQEVQQETKTTNANDKTNKTTADKVTGKVESYEPGKSLKVSVPGKIVSSKSFDLNAKDETYHVSKNIKTGDWVAVTERTDNNGHKTLTVHHSSAKPSTE